MPRFVVFLLLAGLMTAVSAAPAADQDQRVKSKIDTLEKPMFTPFVELYVLEEIKKLRIDLADQKHELMQQILDREHKSVDRAVAYATDTVTYFFYLIAGVTSILLLVGWNSLREIKERMHSFADEELSKVVSEYEKRLFSIEQQLNQKTKHIEENREEIERTRDIQSLWLRAGQETIPQHKIEIYDEILKRTSEDCEALTYKADAVLELNEPQWAANLCHQALVIDPENCHAFYQLGCAYTAMNQFDEAIKYLTRAVTHQESYREELKNDPLLDPLRQLESFQILVSPRHLKT